MKTTTVLITATLGPPSNQYRFGGRNPSIFQRTFEHEIDAPTWARILMHGTFLIPDQCFLKLSTCHDVGGNYSHVHVDVSGDTLCLEVTGSIEEPTEEYLAKMIELGWQRILTEEDRKRFYPKYVFPADAKIFEEEEK